MEEYCYNTSERHSIWVCELNLSGSEMGPLKDALQKK